MIDVLRGFALFGILLVNMSLFKAPGSLPGFLPGEHPLDRAVSLAILAFAQAKFFTLFSFLFGLGFSIQLLNAERRGGRFAPLFLRRLLVLLVFGVVHIVFIWHGDILAVYAVLASLLLLFRKRSPRALLFWAGGLLALQLFVVGAALSGLTLLRLAGPEARAMLATAVDTMRAEFASSRATEIAIYSQGTYGDILVERLRGLPETFAQFILYTPPVFAMFLFGLYAGKRRVFERLHAHGPLLRGVRRWGLALGLLVNLAITALQARSDTTYAVLLLVLGLTLGGPLLSLGYAAGITLLFQHPSWARRLEPLAAPGRMALTNYLLQSIVCTTLFYSYGGALFGRVGAAGGLLVAVALYALQIPFSVWWLRRFPYGPMEWLWRAATYGRPPSRYRSSPSEP